jgi:hypothetical protein
LQIQRPGDWITNPAGANQEGLLLRALSLFFAPTAILSISKSVFWGGGVEPSGTFSCLTGKGIRRITADSVEFEDGERVDLKNPDWQLVKPLIWW